MNRIDRMFAELKRKRRKALIIYITAGYPDMAATERLVPELARSGADMVEIGIPFSDPLADGPTIQRASQCALANGATVKSVLRAVRSVRKKAEIPLVFMTYYNPVLRYGLRRFVKDAVGSGADGIIVPDLPPEEGGELIAASASREFATVFLAAPTSTAKRLRVIAARSRGFIYYVSLTGVTGAREKLPQGIVENVRNLKRLTSMPVCVGFGISGPQQAARISRLADGVIVGSAIIKVIEKSGRKTSLYEGVGSFVRKLAEAVHR